MQSETPGCLRELHARAQQEKDFLTVTEIVDKILSGADKNAPDSTPDVEVGGAFTNKAAAISA